MKRLLERALMRLLGLVAERRPQRAWQLPSVEEIDRARGECIAYEVPQLRICRGPGKGCPDDRLQPTCSDCYLVPWHDKRPSAEIRAAMERGDA